VDILEAIERIEKYATEGRSAFEKSELIQTWVVHHLQIIGEAVRGMSSDLRTRHPELPWAQIIGMRNLLVHHYFGIDKQSVWRVIEKDLTGLKADVNSILGSLGPLD
jgi:uncharacterized protein with HEPN domain